MSDEFNKNCSKNVFEGEGCSIINPELGKARKENFEKKWDFYGRPLFRSSTVYNSEAERRKAMWEMGRKSNLCSSAREIWIDNKKAPRKVLCLLGLRKLILL